MKKGFSLIELIISLAIISFLVLVLSNFFSFNINILNKSYKDENEYKEAYTAMAYIDKTIRTSHKIEAKRHFNSNFTGYIIGDDNPVSSYYFYTSDGFLYIYRANALVSSTGASNRISECGLIDLNYDPTSKIIKVKLTSRKGTYKFETAIYVGDKLWKKHS